MGRIRNPLYLHRYLGFESLSLRHYIYEKALIIQGFFVSVFLKKSRPILWTRMALCFRGLPSGLPEWNEE